MLFNMIRNKVVKFFSPEEVDYFSLTDEELDARNAEAGAALEAQDNEENPPETPQEEIKPEVTTPDPDKVETEDDPNKQPETKTDEEVKPPVSPETEKTNQDKEKTLITDEYLKANFDEDEQRYLSKFIGKPIEEGLKSYAHSQKLIGKKAEEIFSPAEATKQLAQVPHLKIIPVGEKPEVIQAAKLKFIAADIMRNKEKFNIPDTVELPKSFDPKDPDYIRFAREFSYENPDGWDSFKEYRKQSEGKIEGVVKDIEYYSQNRESINDAQISKDVEAIETRYKALGIDLKKDYGIDLSSRDENGENKYINQLLADKNGNLDYSLLTKVNGEIPILKPGALAVKFISDIGWDLIQKQIEKTKISAGTKAFEAAKNRTEPKTLAANPGVGITQDIKKKNDFFQMSDAELDAELERMGNEMANN